jgi:hypothetical protein
MLGSLKAWFVALSALGKAGVITGTVLAAGVTGVAVNGQSNPVQPKPPGSNPPPSCVSTETKTTDKQPVPFEKTTVQDPNTLQGKSYIQQAGVNGEKTITYSVTSYTPSNCKPNTQSVDSEEITTAPITEITAVGSKPPPPPPSCDPNYSGACVPIASDVDCAGGSGNGPAYVSGPVNVIGSDIYGLDRDGDGVGCE